MNRLLDKLKKSMQFLLLIIFVFGGVFAVHYGIKAYPNIRNNFVIAEPEKLETGIVQSVKPRAIFPSVKSVSPKDNATDVVLDIEDPIVIDFDNSTAEFFVKFVLDPVNEVAYENNPEKTQFRLLPKNKILDGQVYKIDIFAKYRDAGDETYKKIFSSSFTTLPPAPTTWDKDLKIRAEQAKKFTRPQITEGKYIDINLASQTMVIFEQGKALDAYIVSSGKRGMDTPKGTFKVENKAKRPLSKEYGLYMPNWMALVPSGKFGIHELPEWPSGYKEGANHLGTPVSHGCVRLGVGAAKRVFDWAEMGTPVVIH